MTTSFVTHSFTRCAVENDEIWVLHMYYNLCLSVLPYVALCLVVSVYFFFLLKKFILSVEAQGRENQMLSLKTYVFLMSNDSSDLSFCKARNVLIPVLFFFFFFFKFRISLQIYVFQVTNKHSHHRFLKAQHSRFFLNAQKGSLQNYVSLMTKTSSNLRYTNAHTRLVCKPLQWVFKLLS